MLADSLISRLTTVLGRQSAMLELKSMKEALKPSDPPTTLVGMLERRLQGEPLQYILGKLSQRRNRGFILTHHDCSRQHAIRAVEPPLPATYPNTASRDCSLGFSSR